jgi:hypothetical protein
VMPKCDFLPMPVIGCSCFRPTVLRDNLDEEARRSG